MFRDAHRLGRKNLPVPRLRVRPRPIIVAFILQKDRNLVMSCARKLKGSRLNIKSDLPKELSEKRDQLLIERKRLTGMHMIARVAERGYAPILEVKRGNRWVKWTGEEDAGDV